MEEQKYIYVVISRTYSKFARLIRKITKTEYNHASISFDRECENLYSFARVQNRVPLVARCVTEFPARFFVDSRYDVKVKVFKIPVSNEDYYRGLAKVKEMYNDRTYMYNFLSVITFPLLKGMETYKAFTCAEFVAFMLRYMNVKLNNSKESYHITPQELCNSMPIDACFEGSLKEFCPNLGHIKHFFDKPHYIRDTIAQIVVLAKLVIRKIKYRYLKYDTFLKRYVPKY